MTDRTKKQRILLDPLFWSIVGLGLILFSSIVLHISDIESIGLSEDAAGYAEIAASLLEGRGPTQDFIDFFFTREPSVPHLTRHWFSLLCLLQMPLFGLFGKTAFLAKFVSTLAYLFSGIFCYVLVSKLFNRETAFLSSVILYLHATSLTLATQGFVDLLFLCFFLVAFFSLPDEQLNFRNICLTIFVWSCGILVKPTFVLIIGAIGLSEFLSVHTRRSLLIFRYASLLTISLLPLFLWNLSYYGEPFVSDHTFLLQRVGYGDNIAEEHYSVLYEKPSVSLPDNADQHFSIQKWFQRGLVMLLGLFSISYYAEGGISLWKFSVFPFCLFALPGLYLFPNKRVKLRMIVILSFWLFFFTFIFTPTDRYFMPWIGILIIISSYGFSQCVKILGQSLSDQTLSGILNKSIFCILILVVFVTQSLPTLRNFYYKQPFSPFNEMIFREQPFFLEICRDIAEETPAETTIMTLLPATVHFHTSRKTIAIPYEDYATVMAVAAHYKVTHFLDLAPRRLYSHHFALPDMVLHKTWHDDDGTAVCLYEIKTSEETTLPLWTKQRGFLFKLPTD